MQKSHYIPVPGKSLKFVDILVVVQLIRRQDKDQNQLTNNLKINELETFASDWSLQRGHFIIKVTRNILSGGNDYKIIKDSASLIRSLPTPPSAAVPAIPPKRTQCCEGRDCPILQNQERLFHHFERWINRFRPEIELISVPSSLDPF